MTLDFNGHIDLTDTLPHFDFTASIEYLDFEALNLANRPLEMSGDIDFDFTYHDLFNLDGTAHAYDLKVLDDTVHHKLDSLRINSRLNDGVNKNLQVVSDLFDFHLIGAFDLRRMPATIKKLLQTKHPQLAKKLKLDGEIADSMYAQQDFHFNGTLMDSRGVQKLFDSSLGDFREVVLNGSFSNELRSPRFSALKYHNPFCVAKIFDTSNISLLLNP